MRRLLLELSPILVYTAWLLLSESVFHGQSSPILQFIVLTLCAGLALVNPVLRRSSLPRLAAALAIAAAWLIALFLWTFVFVFLYRGDAL